MDKSYQQHKIEQRVEEVKRLLSIHKSTLERRVRIDEVIENSLDSIECELILLTADVKKGA